MSFFEELKRRNVVKVAIAYAVASWLLLQLSDILVPLLGLADSAQRLILLLLVIGFVPALIFAWAFEMTPEGIKKEKDVDRSQSITSQTGRKLDRIIIGFLALAVILLLADRFMRSPADSEPQLVEQIAQSEVESESAPEPEDTSKSIAVLPFNNMSDDAGNEFFSDGISEEILNALARVRELKVAGRTSSWAFKGRNEDLREIGEALGVNHILEGSVRKAGNTVRVTAQLIQVSDGFHLWSDTYDRELDDIFAIQDEIAGAILQELKAELMGGQSIASTRVDPVVYEKYLLAKQHMYTRSRPELEAAAGLLKEATESDPGFAPAWAQLGIATFLLSDNSYGTIPHEDAQRIGRLYLDKSLEIDENQAEALAGMGLYYNEEPGGSSTYNTAIPYLERALAINPSLIDASNWLQTSYGSVQRTGDALRILEEMFNRDPFYRPGVSNLILNYAWIGRFDEAEQVLEHVRPFVRDEAWIALREATIRLFSGRYGEAYQLALHSLESDPPVFGAQAWSEVAMSNLGMDEELVNTDTESPFPRLYSMIRLDRQEEGRIYAHDWADRLGDPGTVITFYHSTNQPEKLVEYIDERWPELETFAAEFPAFNGFGYGYMLNLANAYSRTGDAEKFQQAMQLVRAAHDRQAVSAGGSFFMHFAETSYWSLMLDTDKALDHLEIALSQGGSYQISDISLNPEWEVLQGDPRFTELSRKAHEQFNAQRILAGLEPVEAEFSL